MARKFIKDLPAGTMVDDQVFMLTQKDLRLTSGGAHYIHAVLADRTGQLPGRLWQASPEIYQTLPQEGFVRVRGRTENYKGAMQFIIEGIRPTDIKPEELEDFLPQTTKDIETMFARVLEILRSIKDRRLLFLVKEFVDDKVLMDRFKRAPAAMQMHHAYIGGLLEHTLNLMELALRIGPYYAQLNLDLLVLGAFLHDLGKTQELRWDGAFKYTDAGQLVGHLVQATMMVAEKAKAAEKQLGGKPFPDRLLRVVQHLILSHHGDYAFGSPRLPMTTEALALHYIDNLDAKMEQARIEMAGADDTDPDANWTGYVKSLDRKLFKADPFADEATEAEAAAAKAAKAEKSAKPADDKGSLRGGL